MPKGKIEFNSDTLGGDFVIMKENGQPTYNFAVVIDDHLMKMTHILRGDDHIANTPKQLAVYEAFGWEPPKFGHMSLIINQETGKKLSKRDESILQFIEQYRSFGYLPEAMFNFITLLGWSPVGEEEIFTKKQFIKQFDPKRLSRSPAKFDQKKLEWINNKYVKAFYDKIKNLMPFTSVNINHVIQEVRAETNAKGRKLFMPIRIAATRQMHGPYLTDELEVLGKSKVLKHIDQTLKEIS